MEEPKTIDGQDGGQDETTATAELTLVDIGIDEIGKLRKDGLRAICKAEGLPQDGKVAGLKDRLRAKKLGGADGYVAGAALCRICRWPVKVRSTRRLPQEDGTFLTQRNLRCEGPKRHTYQDTV